MRARGAGGRTGRKLDRGPTSLSFCRPLRGLISDRAPQSPGWRRGLHSCARYRGLIGDRSGRVSSIDCIVGSARKPA